MAIKKEQTKPFSVNFPVSLLEEIDQICATHYLTRTSWLIKASKEQLRKERVTTTEDIIDKIAIEEKKFEKKQKEMNI